LNTENVSHFTSIELFALCIASAVHDLDHPGINNNFLVQIQHPLAKMYNDTAVLESHHVARAFEIAHSENHNIFSTMTSEQYRHVRKLIISIVLATGI
jgi:cAMP-specific phosphodiesterase 4